MRWWMRLILALVVAVSVFYYFLLPPARKPDADDGHLSEPGEDEDEDER
jgi:hypothetical protein